MPRACHCYGHGLVCHLMLNVAGLTCEGIYRISGVKSKVQQLKDAYNRGLPVNLAEHDPNTVASLLKIFLRELPESVLTSALVPRFEQASSESSMCCPLFCACYYVCLFTPVFLITSLQCFFCVSFPTYLP